jgi:hypothetical protein
MPISLLLLAALTALIFYPLYNKYQGKATEKFFYERWRKDKPHKRTKPEINYSRILFILFIVVLVIFVTAMVFTLVNTPS